MCSGWGGLLFMTTLDSLHNKRVNEQITTLPLETVWSHGSAKTDEGEPAAAAAVAAAETLQVQACRRHTFLQVFVRQPPHVQCLTDMRACYTQVCSGIHVQIIA